MKTPSAALAVLLFSLSAASFGAPPALPFSEEYAGALSAALLEDAELPPAPDGLDAWRAQAQELANGRLPVVSREKFEERIAAFCVDLRLDDERSGLLLLHLRERVQGVAWHPEKGAQAERALLAKDHKTVSSSLQAHVAALGLLRSDTAPDGVFPGAPSPWRSGKPSPALAAVRSRLFTPPPSPQADAPVPWSEISKIVKIGRRPFAPGVVGDGLDSLSKRLRSPKGQAAAAEAMVRKAFDLMQEAPEGREVLRELIAEYSRLGKTVLVAPKKFKGSVINVQDGVEHLLGLQGQADSDEGSYVFNDKFLDFKDRAWAEEFLAGNMAHEFRHLVNDAQLRRLSPDSVEAAALSLMDEQRARQTGYLVAARISRGRKPTGDTLEAQSLAQAPEAFWDDLKLVDSYATSLDNDEMREPLIAYQRRLELLKGELKAYKVILERRLPRKQAALRIMTEREGLGKDADVLRKDLKADLIAYPDQCKGLAEAIREISRFLDRMKSPANQKELEAMKRLPDSEAMRKFSADFERDRAALVRLLDEKPLPKAQSPKGVLTWEEFWKKVGESRAKNPQYWVEFDRKYGAREAK